MMTKRIETNNLIKMIETQNKNKNKKKTQTIRQ